MSATHLPGIQNTEADFESRKYEIHTEWKLNESVFHFICGELGFSPTIDLFATRINTQLRNFVSYRLDPNCVAVNAFLINWEKEKLYTFLHLHVYPKPFKKIYQEKAKGILIAPNWSSQPFYPKLIEMSLHIISIPPRKRNLYLPSQPSLLYQLHRKVSRLACSVDEATIH